MSVTAPTLVFRASDRKWLWLSVHWPKQVTWPRAHGCILLPQGGSLKRSQSVSVYVTIVNVK